MRVGKFQCSARLLRALSDLDDFNHVNVNNSDSRSGLTIGIMYYSYGLYARCLSTVHNGNNLIENLVTIQKN